MCEATDWWHGVMWLEIARPLHPKLYQSALYKLQPPLDKVTVTEGQQARAVAQLEKLSAPAAVLAAPIERKEGWTRNKLGSKQIRVPYPANVLNKTEISWFPEKSSLSSRLGLARIIWPVGHFLWIPSFGPKQCHKSQGKHEELWQVAYLHWCKNV